MFFLIFLICLFLFLKLKTLNDPIITRIMHPILSTGILSEITTSCPVIKRKTAANAANKVHIVCILCSIEGKVCIKLASVYQCVPTSD